MVAQKNICRLERSSLVLLQLSSFLTKGRVVREGEVVSFFLVFFFFFLLFFSYFFPFPCLQNFLFFVAPNFSDSWSVVCGFFPIFGCLFIVEILAQLKLFLFLEGGVVGLWKGQSGHRRERKEAPLRVKYMSILFFIHLPFKTVE